MSPGEPSPFLSNHKIIAPPDKYNIVYAIFLLWGIGVLLPWNAVLTCFGFFIEEMPGYQPAFVYPFAVNGLNALSQIWVIVYGYKYSNRVKIQLVFFLAGLLTLALPLLAHLLPDPKTKFIVCFLALNLFGLLNGILQGQVFGLGGILPGQYMGAIMFGNGLSGVGCNVLMMIFLASMPKDTNYLQALIFFIISACVLFACSFAFSILESNEFFKHFQNQSKNKDQRYDVDMRANTKMADEERRDSARKNADDEHKKLLAKRQKIDKIVEKKHTCAEFAKQFKANFTKAWKILMSLWLVFAITFVVFPGVFFQSHFSFMKNLGGNEQAWYNLTIILLFNVLDTVGRKLGGLINISATMVYILSLARFVFICTTILIATKEDGNSFIETDTFKMINVLIFSFSNGFVSTLCAIKAPQFVDETQKEQVGIFVGLFIILGITVGSIIAIPIGNAMSSLPSHWNQTN